MMSVATRWIRAGFLHRWIYALVFVLSPACALNPMPLTPQTAAWDLAATVGPGGVTNVSGTLAIDGGATIASVNDATNRIRFHLFAPPTAKDQGATLTVTAPGYQPTTRRVFIGPDWSIPHTPSDGPELVGITLGPTLPPPPSRDQALNVCMSFQGITVHTEQFGDLPWYDPALAWLSKADRQAVYAAKHASKNAFCPNGDTHLLYFVPWGTPLYDEPNNAYSPDRFPTLDWTAGNTKMDPQFVQLYMEIRENGFIPLLAACGDGSDPSNYACAMAETPLMLEALRTEGPRDLRMDGPMMPGFDGVFYGWGSNGPQTRQQILSWAQLIRSTCPLCHVAIEHGTGHIPLGEGDTDWVNSGDMQTWYDLLLSEFEDNRFDDTLWQIAARTLGPVYVRPPDQPATDDPQSPFCATCGQFYLRQPGPRGKIYACALEFSVYGFVRWRYTGPQVVDQRKHFVDAGYACGG